MAGPYAHILVCQHASKDETLPEPLRKLLAANPSFLCLGAVSPDLPAIWDRAEAYLGKGLPGQHSHEWSDRFHEQDKPPQPTATNLVVMKAFAAIRLLPDDERRLASLAWLFGYAGHIITDVVVHPVVRLAKEQVLKDGTYDPGFAPRLHQVIEVVMDTLLVKSLEGKEIEETPILPMLAAVEDSQNQVAHDQTMAAWSYAIHAAYGADADPGFWCSTYIAGLKVAKSSKFQFRGYTYPKADKIVTKDRESFYDQLLLPNDDAGDFESKVFALAKRRVVKRWAALWDLWLTNDDGTGIGGKNVVANWNLNSGANYTTNKLNDLWPAGPTLVLHKPQAPVEPA